MSNNFRELVFIPTQEMGHFLSFLKVAKLILQHNNQISILIILLNDPLHLSSVKSHVDYQVQNNTHLKNRLTFVTLPQLSDPPPLTTTKYFKTFIDLQKQLVKQAIFDRTTKPVGFVVDMLCTSLFDVANDFNVPSYVFFPLAGNMIDLMLYFQYLVDFEGVDILTEFSDPNKVFSVPGFKNQVFSKVVPELLIDKNGGYPIMLDHARRFRKSKGIIVNTFHEIDPFGVDALFDQVSKGDIPNVYPVGPILELDRQYRPSLNNRDKTEYILNWLDDQPLSSVVFLRFGSLGNFNEDQVKEIAKGLENSGQRFLWSLRKSSYEENETFVDALPQGFIDRTCDRGKIIGWAPQVSILAHKAIGGFVSHCGWNSILESTWFGVPIATWPIYAEQQLNAFELIKELEIGVEITMDYKYCWKKKEGNFLVEAQEIENGVRKLMNLSEETKAKVRMIRDKGREAIEKGGSSYIWLDRFIEDLLK